MQSKDFKAVEQTTEQGTEETKVKSAVDNIGQMQKQESEAPWVKGIPVANAAEEKIIPGINSSKLIQREWTCAVCQVTTTSEHDLKSHLGGKRHRTNCAELKPIKRVINDPGSCSPKATDLPNQVKNESAKHAHAGGGLNQETNVKPEKATGVENQVKNEPAKPNAPAEGGSKQKTNASVSTVSKPFCSFCDIWPPCEAALVAHLKGRKHLSKLKQMGITIANEPAKREKETGLENQVKNEPAKPNAPAEGGSKQKANASVSTDSKPFCSFCNIWPPCEAALVAHLKGRKHLSKLKQMGILMV
ncbi:PREDICTED: UBP1-associated proteins 1C-like isoform X3 [Ipomoea nil]|uniref:UBP1-associated proteins 1C-like isoform X3 n=1 Tax=Ipomoea nil TaxID=35883 RepID=UPI000900F39A|nr:PREDICTED: UBP1-associated proteins 1C-like isoform X3 [Ipomoea nil]